MSVLLLLIEFPFYRNFDQVPSFFTGLPKNTELRAITEAVASSQSAKSSTSVHPTTESSRKEEEETRKKKRPSDAPTEANKKSIMVRVRKSTKKGTWARVPDPNSLYGLRDYLEDDDMEFAAHELADTAQERTSSEGSDCKAEPSLAREVTHISIRAADVIDVSESPS